jgi:hypothetical protein
MSWCTICAREHPVDFPCPVRQAEEISRQKFQAGREKTPRLQAHGRAIATVRFDPRLIAALSPDEAGSFFHEIYLLMTGQPADADVWRRHGVEIRLT